MELSLQLSPLRGGRLETFRISALIPQYFSALPGVAFARTSAPKDSQGTLPFVPTHARVRRPGTEDL